MIRKRELRIGNWIQEDGSMEEFTVEALPADLPEEMVHHDGIPLSSEWLERFEVYMIPPKGLRYGFQKVIYWIEFSGENLGWRMMDRENHWIGCEYIKYVHQLQNLYFSLCGEELTLKE